MVKFWHDKSLDEECLESTTLYAGRIFEARKDKVSLPDGSSSIREYVHHSPGVAVVPVLDDGSIVLVKQCRYAYHSILWELPAGKMDKGPGEDPLECGKRELSEETGYEAEHWQELVTLAPSPGYTDELIHTYKAWGLKQVGQHLDEGEFLKVKAFKPEEIKRMVLEGELFDAKTLCALYACELLK